MGQGFRRRSDDEDAAAEDLDMEDGGREGVLDGDLMAEFSELNYQLAKPEQESQPEKRETANLSELQRLISNLQELQQLNVSLDRVQPQPQAQPQSQDAVYLQSLQDGHSNETFKSRRQSEANTTTEKAETTTQAPTRISLSLGLDDGDMDTGSTIESSSSSSSSPSPSPSPSDSNNSTEESRNGSLDDLADSFGPDPVTEDPPPAKKKNGFYFLADWNSFLEVGDGDDQVVVRLSPKIGDPRLFLPVKIPSS
ncbi:GL14389 [Drosophila persimilis]|uniref:GL14389 n=2 Tax=Drosophila persimilis TaxID=7234 RepID=B4GTN4_DROPE|nr:GL14389 [Drosophila persimilis]